MPILLPKHIMTRPDGAYWETDDGGRIVEADLLQCAHCQYTWRFLPGSGRKRGTCTVCGGIVCGKPRCMAACEPFMDRLYAEERAEERAARG